MNLFQEIIEDIGKLSTIKTNNYIYENYELLTFDSRYKNAEIDPMDKEAYIIGVKIAAKKLINNGRIKIYENPNVLIDLLNLAENIEKDWHIYGRNDTEESQKMHSDEIIKLCYKYGLLFISRFLWNNYSTHNHTTYGFSLKDFKQNLMYLYGDFKKWYELTYFDLSDFKDSRYYKNIESLEDIEKEKEMLSYSNFKYPGCSPHEIDISYNKHNGKYEISISTITALDVAIFQFKMLMVNPTNNPGVSYCNQCGKIFYVNHKSEKYCDACKPDQNRNDVRNFRKRKSEIIKLYHEGISIKELAEKYNKTETQIKKWINN